MSGNASFLAARGWQWPSCWPILDRAAPIPPKTPGKQEASAPPLLLEAHYTLNGVRTPELLTRDGQARTAVNVLRDLADNRASVAHFQVTAPDEAELNRLSAALQRGNRFVRGEGLWTRLLAPVFRLHSGIDGPLPLVAYQTSAPPGQPPQLIATADLSAFPPEKRARLAAWLVRRYPQAFVETAKPTVLPRKPLFSSVSSSSSRNFAHEPCSHPLANQ